MKYFRIFGSTYFILKDRENVGKFDSQSDEGIFLGYSSTSKAYRVYNKRTMKVMETVNVVIDESSDSSSEKGDVHKIYTIKYSHIYIFSFTFMLFCA